MDVNTVNSWNEEWMGGWIDGWKDGWMDGRNERMIHSYVTKRALIEDSPPPLRFDSISKDLRSPTRMLRSSGQDSAFLRI